MKNMDGGYEKYIDHNFQPSSQRKLDLVKDIIEDYRTQNLTLTLRQLFYQLVSKNEIPNKDNEYKNLSNLLSDARMAGIIPWGAIVDRTREPHKPYCENDISDSLWRTYRQYKLNRMRNQDVHLEVMIEKMALYEIVTDVTDVYSIIVSGNKGNTSDTMLHDCSKRLIAAYKEGKPTVILYIGDHDPSGKMMVDNIRERLSILQVPEFEFRLIALSQQQALENDLPPNPIKKTDTNAREYARKYGNDGWECDALPTKKLQEILRREICSCIDFKKLDEIQDQEKSEKEQLKQILDSWGDN